MAAEVLTFARKPAPATAEPQVQHGTGSAFCLSCKHTWTAVAPIGVESFECPLCMRLTGHWKGEFTPAEGQKVRECNCGNQLFYLTPDGHLCANCGIYQSY